MMEKMQNAMMAKYKMFAWMGLVIVLIAFLLALNVGGANATFFSVSKATREGAAVGDLLVDAHVKAKSLAWWVPSFKFTGLGIMLGAITMALGLIATTLRNLGKDVMAGWPDNLDPGTPPKPPAAKLFPMIMMMGWMVFLVGLIWAWGTTGMVGAYWNHSIANELNPAQPGSALLTTLGVIKATAPWLVFLRMTGMALLFTAITVALTVVIRTLQHQEQNLIDFIRARTGG